jgi:hypothetical protein
MKPSTSDSLPLPQDEEDFDLEAVECDDDADGPASPDTPPVVVRRKGKGGGRPAKADDIHHFFTVIDVTVVDEKGEETLVKQRACNLCR